MDARVARLRQRCQRFQCGLGCGKGQALCAAQGSFLDRDQGSRDFRFQSATARFQIRLDWWEVRGRCLAGRPRWPAGQREREREAAEFRFGKGEES